MRPASGTGSRDLWAIVVDWDVREGGPAGLALRRHKVRGQFWTDRSALTCSATPACSGSKGWFRSIATGSGPVDRRIGSVGGGFAQMRGHFLGEADGCRAAQDAGRDAAAERRVGILPAG